MEEGLCPEKTLGAFIQKKFARVVKFPHTRRMLVKQTAGLFIVITAR
jgi:hypothetical protein